MQHLAAQAGCCGQDDRRTGWPRTHGSLRSRAAKEAGPDAVPAQARDDRDQVLEGAAEAVQGPDDQGVTGPQGVQGLAQFLPLGTRTDEVQLAEEYFAPVLVSICSHRTTDPPLVAGWGR